MDPNRGAPLAGTAPALPNKPRGVQNAYDAIRNAIGAGAAGAGAVDNLVAAVIHAAAQAQAEAMIAQLPASEELQQVKELFERLKQEGRLWKLRKGARDANLAFDQGTVVKHIFEQSHSISGDAKFGFKTPGGARIYGGLGWLTLVSWAKRVFIVPGAILKQASA